MHLFMIPHVDIISRGSLTQGNSFFIFYIYCIYISTSIDILIDIIYCIVLFHLYWYINLLIIAIFVLSGYECADFSLKIDV